MVGRGQLLWPRGAEAGQHQPDVATKSVAGETIFEWAQSD